MADSRIELPEIIVIWVVQKFLKLDIYNLHLQFLFKFSFYFQKVFCFLERVREKESKPLPVFMVNWHFLVSLDC